MFKQGDILERTSEQLLGEDVQDALDAFPTLTPLKLLHHVFPKVCPLSLLNNEVDELITMEAFCREYNLQPLGKDVGYMDYPYKLINAFSIITNARERQNAERVKAMKEQQASVPKTPTRRRK